MLRFEGPADLRRIVVLNPKGGSGKTTLAFNLAGYIASTGRKVALVDMDRQGSSTRWLQNRAAEHPAIHGIPVVNFDGKATADQCVVVPDDIDIAVIDAPAGLAGPELVDYTCGAHAILVPVLPSDLDIHAATSLVSDLLLVAQVSRRNGRLGVVANRVNERTVGYQQLSNFLSSLSIAVVGTLRDTQNYVWAASSGLSIHEMQPHRVSKDLAQWETVTQWLEGRLATPLTPRDLLRPPETATRKKRGGMRAAIFVPAAAAAMTLLAVSLWSWMAPRDAATAIPPEPAMVAETPRIVPIERAEVAERDDSLLVDASEILRQKWQLSGIATVGGASVMILSDRHDKTIRRISAKDDLDGWTVAEAGPNYAVFSQKGQRVRLVLNEDAVD